MHDQNEKEKKLKEEQDLQVAETLQKIVQHDWQKYLEFRRLVDYHLESLMNKQLEHQHKLLPLSGYGKLLFKATDNGFTAQSFHQKCDNQGPTISFILSEHGQVFGGYTSVSWTSPFFWDNIKDNDAFIFSLTKNTIHNQYQDFDNAIGHQKDYLMVFGGGGGDIRIYDESNNDSCNNWCHLGYTYMPPQDFKDLDQQTKEYLGGSDGFKVIEIEVYQVLK
ncbi:UNKNOWN [Stylonychia lemnae]|uniref:TLDc domain-containing protein n=1 Tax=Stylonychia lemnae TaxID=5949 RepID=A0A078AYT5_STYLE|nr:UNKNOWN [Stylonychia lemnae]|eukprot:CDW87296.1 UNKNOWN [Stylonychia lemnae]